MPVSRTKLYFILAIACLAGYAWLFLQLRRAAADPQLPTVCFVKTVTGIPCPSCGSTRSMVELIRGHWLSALQLNPLGYVLLAGLLTIPGWIAFDLIDGGDSLRRAYLRSERFIRQPLPAIIFASLILLNWIWNIVKAL